MIASKHREVKPYHTKDGSIIRELVHPLVHANSGLSLAEAVVPAGQKTLLHRHLASEEIYYVTAGRGLMTLGKAVFAVEAGDSICIPAKTVHRIENTGAEELKILCCCAPAYSHEDTEVF